MTPVTKQEENNKRLYSTKRKEKKIELTIHGWLLFSPVIPERKTQTVKTDNELMVISAQSFSNMLM